MSRMSFSNQNVQVAIDPDAPGDTLVYGHEQVPPGIVRVIFDKAEPHPNLWHEFIAPEQGHAVALVGGDAHGHDGLHG